MKRLLPFLVCALLAFAGCQNSPADEKQEVDNAAEIVLRIEKFTQDTEKDAPNYSAQDWDSAMVTFIEICKIYKEQQPTLTQEDKNRFDKDRVAFVNMVNSKGGAEIAGKFKEEFNAIN